MRSWNVSHLLPDPRAKGAARLARAVRKDGLILGQQGTVLMGEHAVTILNGFCNGNGQFRGGQSFLAVG